MLDRDRRRARLPSGAGDRAITADTALRLGRYFGVNPQSG
jgi:hypothetical protein